MNILVINAGSSSIKFDVFDITHANHCYIKGEFERFSAGFCHVRCTCQAAPALSMDKRLPLSCPDEALRYLPTVLQQAGLDCVDAVGHRVTHGGEYFNDAILIDDAVIERIESLMPLAPLHNALSLAGIRIARTLWPQASQVAVFDTAFHATIPACATTYAVPDAWRKVGLRRYGFHGTSHKSVALRVAQALQVDVTNLKIISCHLGNGASVCAIHHGCSVDTSMGMTPLEGLVMGTRCGDVDPGLFAFLQRTLGLSINDIERQLYQNSGLKALSGVSHDLRVIEQRAATNDADAQLAINVYAYRVRKYIGAYAAAMGGVDVLAFTGGIGEHSAAMRQRICANFEFLGLYLDEDKNNAVHLQGYKVAHIHQSHSRIQVCVAQTGEQFMIAQEVKRALRLSTD